MPDLAGSTEMAGPCGPAGLCAVTFRVRAETAFGDSIVLVGSGKALGDWDPHSKGMRMTTTPEAYPLWTSASVGCQAPVAGAPVEYKYVRLTNDGRAEWEAEGGNRRLPQELAQHQQQRMVIDDGVFGYIQPESFGFPEGARFDSPGPAAFREPRPDGLRLAVVGDATAAGHGAWRFEGWAARLSQALRERYGYDYANVAALGMDTQAARKDFAERMASLQPSVVVLALGGELQRLAKCPEHERAQACKQFLAGLEGLVEMTWELGALPVVGGLYPHADFQQQQTELLRETHQALKDLGVPMLDWLDALAASPNGGSWAEGLSHDPAHPNTEGHKKMFAAIDLSIFEPASVRDLALKGTRALKSSEEHACFADGNGFEVRFVASKKELIVENRTANPYQLSASWPKLQESLRAARRAAPWVLKQGLYVAAEGAELPSGAALSVALAASGCVETEADVPSGCRLVLQHVSGLLAPSAGGRLLFHDGTLGIIRITDGFRIINQATCEYNVHPMWQAARLATRALPQGVYEDGSGQPFRTAVVSAHGLQSRVKVPARSAVQLKRTGPLSSLKRIAVLPLGDRCSIRMLLHKIEYDGPCYPFDLTRTTSLADVADMVATGFSDMWNEHLLEYNHEAGRIMHKKWHGLSFAHEVEDGDDPVCNFGPVAARMAKRYTGRAARFDYAAKHADSVLFLRTGIASRGEVMDLLTRVCARFPGIHANLVLISDQPSEEFNGMLGVTHVREHFDPDRMYEDLGYWMNCAHRFRCILDGLGVSARSLYWCPNNLKEAEKEEREALEAQEAEARAEAQQRPKGGEASQQPKGGEVPILSSSEVSKFSHSNLYELEARGLGA